MLSAAAGALRAAGFDSRALYQHLSAASLTAAIREQGLHEMAERLRAIVPDLRDQYTGALDEVEYRRYWETKLRGLHAFQVSAALAALKHLGGTHRLIADIGDSSGNHAAYIRALAPPGQVSRIVSVNLDPVAVAKVKAKGGEAVQARAEQLDLEGLRPDLFLSFETVEHLTDPVRFLHALAEKGSADWMLITVPYVRNSRFGGAILRTAPERWPSRMTAEEVHILELCPDDWALLCSFAGFRVIERRLYRQYPMRSPLVLAKPLWQALDFEGFVALILKRDLSLSSRYADW